MSNCMACRISCPQVYRLSSASKRTSCAHVHGLHQSHFGDNRQGTLFLGLNNIYIHIRFHGQAIYAEKIKGSRTQDQTITFHSHFLPILLHYHHFLWYLKFPVMFIWIKIKSMVRVLVFTSQYLNDWTFLVKE